MPNDWVVDDIHELANDILLQSQGGDVSPDLSGYVGVYNTGIDKEAFASGNPITIYSDINQIPEIKVMIVPKQEGSGAPSPTNVRPISGWTGVNLTLNGENIPVSFGEAGTVYGGTLDVTTGLLTVTMVSVDLGTLNWLRFSTSTVSFFYVTISNARSTGSATRGICSHYNGVTNLTNSDKAFNWNGAQFRLRDDSYTDAATFKTAMSGVMLVYELATSITYQLTPTEVSLIVGENVISTDSPNTLEVTYKVRS